MAEAEKKYVRLKDAGSTFHDPKTDQAALVGPWARHMDETPRLEKAISGGQLVGLTESEALSWNKKHGLTGIPEIGERVVVDVDKEKESKAKKVDTAELDAEANAKEDAYKAAIGEAEAAMTDKQYKVAEGFYTAALEAKPKDKTATDGLAEAKKAGKK